MPPKIPKRCQFCQKPFATQQAVNFHISASKICLKEWQNDVIRKNEHPLKRQRTNSNSPEPIVFDDEYFVPQAIGPRLGTPTQHAEQDDADDGIGAGRRFIDPFPEAAGEALRPEKTNFEILQLKHQSEGGSPWTPFANRAEWGLAEWLIRHVGQKTTDKYLQLPIVSGHLKSNLKNLPFSKVNSRNTLSFHNNYTFLKKIDQLPTGPDWICNVVTITGNLEDEYGECIKEYVEVWRRDPVECVAELIGNPAFKDYMSYVAEHAYLDKGGKVRIFDEMWTADWWWNTQVSILIYIN